MEQKHIPTIEEMRKRMERSPLFAKLKKMAEEAKKQKELKAQEE